MRLRSAALTLLKLAVAAALIAYVLQNIETRDCIRLSSDPESRDGAAHYYGRLTGDWRGADWSFAAADGSHFFAAATLPPGWKVEPGFYALLRGLHYGWIAAAVACWSVLVVVVGYRWLLLLRAAAVPASYAAAMRLCFIGYFFNNVMLGLTGGDLVRAVLVARGLAEHRVRAVLSVLVDRIIGVLGLLLVGCGALFLADFSAGEAPAELARARLGLVALLLLLFGGAYAYTAPAVRRRLRLDALLARLPGAALLLKIDEALTLYRRAKGALARALLLSVGLQILAALCFWSIVRALGAEGLPFAASSSIYAVVQTLSAVPVAPAGWGVGETLYGRFFAAFGSTFTLGVAASILFRLLTQLGFGLLGGLVWVASRGAGERARLHTTP